MNIFRIDLPADSSTLALKRNNRTVDRAQRDALLRNQLVLENDLSGDLLERSNASMLGDQKSKNYHVVQAASL